jgi:hypothetical protein
MAFLAVSVSTGRCAIAWIGKPCASGCRYSMPFHHVISHLRLADDAPPQGGGEAGDVPGAVRAPIVVAKARIGCPCFRQEGVETREGGGPRDRMLDVGVWNDVDGHQAAVQGCCAIYTMARPCQIGGAAW